MHISSHTLRSALLRIFADAGARAREGLSFTEIARDWGRTGLRDSDLRAAIHELMEGGELLSLERDGALSFALAGGAGWMPDFGYGPEPGLQPAAIGDEARTVAAWRQSGLLADAVLRYRREDSFE
jgi:hypothetical protein